MVNVVQFVVLLLLTVLSLLGAIELHGDSLSVYLSIIGLASTLLMLRIVLVQTHDDSSWARSFALNVERFCTFALLVGVVIGVIVWLW